MDNDNVVERTKQRPEFVRRYPAGNGDTVELSIFEFRHGKEQWLSHSLRVLRSFRRSGSGNEWESSEYLSPESTLVAALLLTEGFVWVQARRDADYRARRSEGELDGEVTTTGLDDDVPF